MRASGLVRAKWYKHRLRQTSMGAFFRCIWDVNPSSRSNRTEIRRRVEDRTARVSMKITARFLAATRRSNILLRLFPGIGITSAVL